MEIPVYILDEANNYSDFTKVMRNIMEIEELRDPLTNRMTQPIGDNDFNNDIVNLFGDSE